MMDALYNFSACALGQFAAYVYFSSRFELKRPRALGIVFPAAAAVQFALSFAGLAALNVAFMFACSFCAALIIYRTNIKQALLHSALLEAFAAVSALAVLFAVPKFSALRPPKARLLCSGYPPAHCTSPLPMQYRSTAGAPSHISYC